MNRQYIIYRIINRLNGKFYIGRTINSLEKRWTDHKSAAKRKNLARLRLYRAINADGINNFYIEMVCTTSSFQELKIKEREYILSSKSFMEDIGYNMSIDTDQGLEIMDPETIKNRRLKSHQRTKLTQYGFGVKKIANRYRSCIIHHKKLYSCSFSSLKDAQIWYDRMSVSFYGNIAILNWPEIKHSEADIQKAHFEHVYGSKMTAATKTGYWGVSKDKSHEFYYVKIGKDGRRYNLGNYQSKEEAAHAFDIAALVLYGVNFNRFNFQETAIKRCPADHSEWVFSRPSQLREYKIAKIP